MEEILFWLGTSFVTLSAVLIFAELERRGMPWWALPAGVVLPIERLIGLSGPGNLCLEDPGGPPAWTG